MNEQLDEAKNKTLEVVKTFLSNSTNSFFQEFGKHYFLLYFSNRQ